MNNSPNTTRPLLCGLLALLLTMLATPGRAQSCTFSDPQKQLEYEAIRDLYASNGNLFHLVLHYSNNPVWDKFATGEICDVCALVPLVGCNANGYIFKVDLSSTNLDTIPESFGNLIHLTGLDLSHNIGLKALPESFGNLDSLESFGANSCALKNLPQNFGDLSSLKSLNLKYNQLASLPASFSQLPSLLSGHLDHNKLTSLPDDIGSLQTHDSALPPFTATYTYLSLISNLLTTVPSSLGNALDLHISADNNKIICIPAELTSWCDPSKNNYLSLSNNPIGIGNLSPFCANPAAYACGAAGPIDLSLTLQQLTPTPTQWGSYQVKATVSNAGPQAATWVKVKFAKPTGVVYVGGNAYSASQGTFNPSGNEVWSVGTVPAGGSATLTVNYFLQQATAPTAYAQVSAVYQSDTDSQPNNGTPPTPTQDDEASTVGSYGEPLKPDLIVSDLQIPGPSVMVGSYVIYNFDAANIGTAAATADFNIKAYFSADQALGADDILVTTLAGFPVSYGVGASHQDITIANAYAPQTPGQYYLIVNIDADGTVAESSEGNNTVVKPFTVTSPCAPDVAPPTIANCPANIAKTTIGTTATFTWTPPTATDNCTATPSLTGSHAPGASFPLGGTVVTYTAKDGANNTATCSFTVTVIQQADGGQVDLSLSLQQLTASPTQWGNYFVKLTINNAGPNAATGVKVRFAKPNGVVYVGGNAYTASQGSFSSDGDEAWTVGSIPAAGLATLTVNYFLLSPTAPVAYAQVIAANEADTDSQPNNGTPPMPAQDDEASTVGGGGGQQPDLTIADLQIPTASVVAGAVLSYNLDASNAGTASFPGGFSIKSYINTDPFLSANDVQDGTIQTGNYVAGFSAQDVAGASTIPAGLAAGQYYLIVKIDADNVVSESREDNNTAVKPFTVTAPGGTSGCGAITVATNPGKITIGGFSAPHVLIKVFRPDWTVAYECLDGQCASPAVAGGLPAGTYHVHVKLIDGSWGELCHIDRDVSVAAGVGGGNGTAIRVDDRRQRLSIDNVYPNPASYSITLDVHSSKEQDTVLDFYDGQGRAVHNMDIHLEEGRNLVEVVVWEWRSGAYSMILRGDGLPAYGRLLKVWE